MAKTAEELNIIKEEVETLNKKLVELNDEKLKQVNGGVHLLKARDEVVIVGDTIEAEGGIKEALEVISKGTNLKTMLADKKISK